jgi:hypothetical protein
VNWFDNATAKLALVCISVAIFGAFAALFGALFGSQAVTELGGAVSGLGAIGFIVVLGWQHIS